MNIDLSYIKEKLENAHYDSAIGIREYVIEESVVNGNKILLLAVKLDAGKELVPHLHEDGDEICMILTSGRAYLGDTKKTEAGEYMINAENKIEVDWEEPKDLNPGTIFKIPSGKAHHLEATENEPFILLFFLPETHLETDRKYVVHP